MKNLIIIDIDSDRESQIEIRKPSDIQPPTTLEETKEVVLNDLACITETLLMMINIASHNGMVKKEAMVDQIRLKLDKLLKENNDKID